MNIGRRTLLLAGAAGIGGCATSPTPSGPVKRYENGLWWNGTAFEPGHRDVSGGVFVASRRADSVVDLGGQFVLPPFADAHVHKVDAQSNAGFVEFGVFYFKIPNSIASIDQALEGYLARPETVDAITAMGGITAPGGHPEPLYVETLRQYVYPDWAPEAFLGQAFHHVTRAADIEPVLSLLQEQGADFVKIYVIHSDEFALRRDDPRFNGAKGLDPSLVPGIVAAAHARNLTVSAHIENAADFRAIIAAGVDEAIHMPGYNGGADPIEQYQITAEDAQAARRRGMRVVTTATVGLRDEARAPRVREIQRANLRLLREAGVPILLGSDGYEHESVLKEARYLIELGIFDSREALINLTQTTPRAIFPNRRIGALQRGFEASFVTLRGDPLRDFNAVFALTTRVKQGLDLDVATTG